MYELATRGVEQFVLQSGRFTPFAIVTSRSGDLQIIETSGEFPDVESAQQGVMSKILEMRDDNQIVACLLCVPVELPTLGAQAGVVMEIEAEGCNAVRIVRQIKHSSGRPALSENISIMDGEARVF